MESISRIVTIAAWTLAIGSEYLTQVWPRYKKSLNVTAMICFALALSGEYVSYRYEELPALQWFQASDTNNETFVLSDVPVKGSEEVLINGLIEPPDIYAVHGKAITISTRMSKTDQITIKYRHYR
jgi:hypothetical protein